MKILIPNATSPKNTGDQAMLASLLELIHINLPTAEVRIHSVDAALQKKMFPHIDIKSSLLSWLMFEKPYFLHRILRCIQAAVAVSFPFFASNTKLKQLLRDYQKSDVIIFVGNGYLRSTKGISQSLLLLLQLIPFVLVKRSKKPTIVAPISFGPFAYTWQASLTAKVLSGISPILVREEISLALIHKYHVPHVILAADLGLLLPKTSLKPSNKNYIGISLRNWYTRGAQRRLEKELIGTLKSFTQYTLTAIKLFVNVDAPEHKDIDMVIATRVYAALKKANVPVEAPIILETYQEAMRQFRSCTVLIGMRMHANIIASTQGIPFVGIAYEHKTMGIANMLHMQQYCLWGNEITTDNLLPILETVFANHSQIQNTLEKTLAEIQKSNASTWHTLLAELR